MALQAAQTQCAPTTRSFTRADIVALGQAGKPWEFLGIAARALDLASEDAAIRFLAAANLAKLGLASLALLQLDALTPNIRADPAVAALERDLRAAPSDRIDSDALRATCAANFQVLRQRGECGQIDDSAWSRDVDSWLVCRARDGNIVRARAGDAAMSRWAGLHDARGTAARTAAELPRPADGFPAPVILDGADPAWMLLECARSRPTTPTGYQPPITVVEPDAHALLWSLASSDLREVLAQERVRVFAGDGAVARFARFLMDRLDTQVAGFCIPVRSSGNDDLRLAYRRICDEQARLVNELRAHVEEIYADRNRDFWKSRYTNGASGGPPLRILVATSRFSTYVQHASADLAAAARAAGHESRLLIERDDASRFSLLAYLREMVDFEPDLVVLINHPRETMKGAFPLQVPYVCWLQDPMPHLFDPTQGAAQTEFDFLAGHLFAELFTRFGYPTTRALPAPVVASSAKFHDGPVDPAMLARHECEIALVSHHSQTPEALLESILTAAALDARTRSALEDLVPVIRRATADCLRVSPHQAIERHVRAQMLARVSRDTDEKSMASVLRNFALPLADRVFRHQAVEWAVDLCARRSWRLHLYGRGWESHPRFGEFARGELSHGEDLRASYRAARVHLHVSLGTLVHQRVLECALSGGMPLCRLHRDALAGFKTRAQLACATLGEPHATDTPRNLVGWAIADCPEAMAMTAQLQRLSGVVGDGVGQGGEPDALCWVRRDRLDAQKKLAAVIDARHEPMWLLGDLAETTFWSPESLEACVVRAVERPAWRQDVSNGIGARVRSDLTHGAFLTRLLKLVRAELATAPSHHRDTAAQSSIEMARA